MKRAKKKSEKTKQKRKTCRSKPRGKAGENKERIRSEKNQLNSSKLSKL